MGSTKPPLTSEQIQDNFKEIAPRLTENEASLEASRCLYCFDAPCIRACPTNIDIPMFIQQIANSDVRGSAKTIFSENIFGGSCGRACPTAVLCEGACVYNDLNQKPIEIGRLQRYATDHAIENDIHFWDRGEDTNRRVAIVGAGPAGLSCAYELAKLGHSCTVYEAAEHPGGLNTYGIAGYKIDTPFSLAEVDYIKKIGIEILLSTPVGTDPSVQDLLKSFDAVFIGVGLGNTASLGIDGEDLEGCYDALEFIRPTRAIDYKGASVGSDVVVIGAGNTAIDVSTAAVRLGAKSVTIVYRRTEQEMSAYGFEYELAKSDGVQFKWLTSPKSIIGENGRVTGIECVEMAISGAGDGAKGKLEMLPGTEHIIPCDMVVKALGQEPFHSFVEGVPGLEAIDGIVDIHKETFATTVAGLFAGGDCVNRGAEVVDAVQHGKVAAKSIHQFLDS